MDFTFAQHQALAAVWVRYNSLSGRCSEAQALKLMYRMRAEDLRRMLAERNVTVLGVPTVEATC